MKEESNLNEQEMEKYFFENYPGKQYYVPNIGLSPVPQKQLEAFTNITFGRHVFKKDLETLPWILDTIQKIEEVDGGEEGADDDTGRIDTSDLKIKLLSYLLSRDIPNSPSQLYVPLFFEQFMAISHQVFILVRVCSVVVTEVPLAIRQQVIDDILKHIMKVPQITMEAKNTFKQCAEVGRIITLTPFETKKAMDNSVKASDVLESFVEEYKYQPGENDDSFSK